MRVRDGIMTSLARLKNRSIEPLDGTQVLYLIYIFFRAGKVIKSSVEPAKNLSSSSVTERRDGTTRSCCWDWLNLDRTNDKEFSIIKQRNVRSIKWIHSVIRDTNPKSRWKALFADAVVAPTPGAAAAGGARRSVAGDSK